MIVRKATAADIRHVLLNLTPPGLIEHLARSPGDDINHVAERLIFASRAAVAQYALCLTEETPAILVGAWEESPGVLVLHGAVTKDFASLGRAWSLFWLRSFAPEVLARARMATLSILCGQTVWQKSLERVGFVPQGGPLPYGKNGELFQDMAWINPAGRAVDRPPTPVGCGQPINASEAH